MVNVILVYGSRIYNSNLSRKIARLFCRIYEALLELGNWNHPGSKHDFLTTTVYRLFQNLILTGQNQKLEVANYLVMAEHDILIDALVYVPIYL